MIHDYHLHLAEQMASVLSDDEIEQFLHTLEKIHAEIF